MLNRSHYYKKSSKISKQAFKELFAFEDNDRDKKQLKKDFKKIEKLNKGGSVKFKHLLGKSFRIYKVYDFIYLLFFDDNNIFSIDYYLSGSEVYGA